MRNSVIWIASAATFSVIGMLAGYLGKGYDVPACTLAGLAVGVGLGVYAVGAEKGA